MTKEQEWNEEAREYWNGRLKSKRGDYAHEIYRAYLQACKVRQKEIDKQVIKTIDNLNRIEEEREGLSNY